MADTPIKQRDALADIAAMPIWREPNPAPAPTVQLDGYNAHRAKVQAAERDLAKAVRAPTGTPPATTNPTAAPEVRPFRQRASEALRGAAGVVSNAWKQTRDTVQHYAEHPREVAREITHYRSGFGSRERTRQDKGSTQARPVEGWELHRALKEDRHNTPDHGPSYTRRAVNWTARKSWEGLTSAVSREREEARRAHSFQPQPQHHDDNRSSPSWSHIPATSPYRDQEVSQDRNPFPDVSGGVPRVESRPRERGSLSPSMSYGQAVEAARRERREAGVSGDPWNSTGLWQGGWFVCPGDCREQGLELGTHGHCKGPRR